MLPVHFMMYFFYIGLLSLIWVHVDAEKAKCLPGFDLAHEKSHNKSICFKIKEPEPFKNKFVNCEENIYNLELHFRLNVTKDIVYNKSNTFWIDYTSSYADGPYTNLMKYGYNNVSVNKTSCLIVNNMDVITRARCDEMHNRYCFMKPISEKVNFTKLYNAKYTCLFTIRPNVTWNDAKSLCQNAARNTRWSYSNGTAHGITTFASRNEVEDQIEQLLAGLGALLASQADPLVNDINPIFDEVNNLLQVGQNLPENSAHLGELVRLLHQLGQRVDLLSSSVGDARTVRDDVVSVIVDIQMMTRGIIVSHGEIFVEQSIVYIQSNDQQYASALFKDVTDVALSVTPQLAWGFRQFSFLVFRFDDFFQDSSGVYAINSRIISINLLSSADLGGEIVHIHTTPLIQGVGAQSMRRACVFWEFREDDTGFWSEEGCSFIRYNDNDLLDTCECPLKLTYYAQALDTTPLEVHELIERLLNDLRVLVTLTPTINEIDDVFEQMNHLLGRDDVVFPDNEILHLFLELGSSVTFDDDWDVEDKLVKNNIAQVILSPQAGASGIVVANGELFSEDAIHLIREDIDTEMLNPNVNEVVISLPQSIWWFHQMNFLLLRDDSSFIDERGIYEINSRILSIYLAHFDSDEEITIDLHLRPLLPGGTPINMRPVCVHWELFEDGNGQWSEDGCVLIHSHDPETLDTCQCTSKLTFFAEALITLTYQEQIDLLLNDLRRFVEEGVALADVDGVFDRMDYLLSLEYVVLPDELMHLFLELGMKIDPLLSSDEWNTAKVVRPNIAIIISRYLLSEAFMIGITLADRDYDHLSESSFDFVDGGLDIDIINMNINEAALLLFYNIFSVVVLKDDRSFNVIGQTTYYINSIIFGIHLYGNVHENQWIELYLRPIVPSDGARDACVRWHYLDDYTGFWTEEGCILRIRPYPEMDLCMCDIKTTYYARALTSDVDETTPTTVGTTIDLTTTSEAVKTTIDYTITVTDVVTTTTMVVTTPLTPEEHIDQVLEDMYELLNQTDPIKVEDTIDIIDQVNSLLYYDDVEFPGEMLQLLDDIFLRVVLNETLTAGIVRDNIGVMIGDATPENPIRGLIVATRETDYFTPNAFEFYTDDLDTSLLNVNLSEVVVSLPLSASRMRQRISFVVFRDDRIFNFERDVYVVNSRVISIGVGNNQFERDEVIDIHLRTIRPSPNRDERRACSYWHFRNDSTGYWSQDGCRLIRSGDPWMLDTCRCDHLTHFAEVLIPRPVFSQGNEDALEILSIIGCMLSILGLSIIILTAVLFRTWRKKFHNQINLQLSIALFIMNACFLVVVFANYDQYYRNISCTLTGIVLHYSLLASFCWLTLRSYISFRDMVFPYVSYRTPDKKLIFSVIAWGVPLLIISIVLIAAPLSYSNHFAEISPTTSFCYPSGTTLWLAVYTPVVISLIISSTLLVIIICNKATAGQGPRSTKQKKPLEGVRSIINLTFLFGLPWLFGLFAYNIVAAYLFTCTVTTQGFILFISVVCRHDGTRNLWHAKLTTSGNYNVESRATRDPHSTNRRLN